MSTISPGSSPWHFLSRLYLLEIKILMYGTLIFNSVKNNSSIKKTPKKVTMIGTLPPIKAVSPYCLHLVRELAKKVDLQFIGFKSITPGIFYSGGPKEKETESKKIINVEINNIISWYNPFSWISAGLKAKGEIVHIQHWATYTNIFYCVISPILKIRNKKIVITIHNITPHVPDKGIVLIDKLLNKILFPFAHAFIVHNERNKKKLISLYSIQTERIFIVTHGVLIPEKLSNISKQNARELIRIPKNKKVILFFGYLWNYKGLDTLLYSLNNIRNEIPTAIALIVGQPLEGRGDWKPYQTIINENNLQNNIMTRLEYIPESEIEIYFSAADLVVLPYREPFDTHGGVAAFAITFKKPLVVTDIGGLPEYVKDPSVISTPDDVTSLSKIIIRVLKNHGLLSKLSKDSEDIAQELTWDKIAEKTVNVYGSVMNEKN
jgi:glycosyltransferase involved in cell wall biosynthesis